MCRDPCWWWYRDALSSAPAALATPEGTPDAAIKVPVDGPRIWLAGDRPTAKPCLG